MCRPDIPAEVHSFIFERPSWNIFFGTVSCGGSIILGALLSCFKYAVVYSSVSGEQYNLPAVSLGKFQRFR